MRRRLYCLFALLAMLAAWLCCPCASAGADDLVIKDLSRVTNREKACGWRPFGLMKLQIKTKFRFS